MSSSSDSPDEPKSIWIWSKYGFLQLHPSTFGDYELPELTPDEQIKVAMYYIKKYYVDPPSDPPDKPSGTP